jgi:hypothetical protein
VRAGINTSTPRSLLQVFAFGPRAMATSSSSVHPP